MSASAKATVLIADDEPLARERIRMLLESHGGYEVTDEVGDGQTALSRIRHSPPALAFLDISMPGRSGVEVADAVAAELLPTAVVFVTAHDEFAIRAFEVGALDYLVKPVDRERFDQTLARVERRAPPEPESVRGELRTLLDALREGNGRRRRFVVRTPKGHYFVPVTEVEAAVADGNYLALHAGGRVHLVRETMKSFEASVDPSQFIRVHRSVIVNVDYIERVEGEGHGEYRIVTRRGTRFESSRAYGDRVRELLR